MIYEKHCQQHNMTMRSISREELFHKWGVHLKTFHYPEWGKDLDRTRDHGGRDKPSVS